MYVQKIRQINNIPADAGHFLRTQIDSTNFPNENLTTKVGRNKAENSYVFKRNILKDLETDETIKQSKCLKNIGQRNKSNKIAKDCWLSRYKRSR